MFRLMLIGCIIVFGAVVYRSNGQRGWRPLGACVAILTFSIVVSQPFVATMQ